MRLRTLPDPDSLPALDRDCAFERPASGLSVGLQEPPRILLLYGSLRDRSYSRLVVDEAARRVREGAPINRALQKSGYFPPMVVHLIASGEASGNLDDMLERAATSQERELETAVSALMGILEPALILVMGVVVLVIVLAILLPIFDMNQLVH